MRIEPTDIRYLDSYSVLQNRYRVYSEDTGVLPLRQGEKETVDSQYNSEPFDAV